MKVILPGSYDPVTLGHLDVIRRASETYEEVSYEGYGLQKKVATLLYPSNDGKVAITDVKIKDDLDDTTVELVFADGSAVTVNENDYPVSADSAERFN